jgi:hypothetical protein
MMRLSYLLTPESIHTTLSKTPFFYRDSYQAIERPRTARRARRPQLPAAWMVACEDFELPLAAVPLNV